MVAIVATYSMVALAASDRVAGELTVTGNANTGDAPVVTVNGEEARSGRTIFSSSVITTSANANAIINLGKTGIIELAPNTSFTVTFDDKTVSGELSTGRISILGAPNSVSVKTSTGRVVTLATGQSVNSAGQQTTDDDAHGGVAWWIWAVIFGGAAAGLLIAAIDSNNRVALGGTTTTISPVR